MKHTAPRIPLQFLPAIYPLLLVLCLVPCSQPFAQDKDWESELLSKARTSDHNGLEYVGLQELAELLQIQTYYSNKVRKAILYFDQKITVTAHNPFVIVGQTVVQLPVECQFFDGDIHVPVNFFLPIVRPFVQLGTPDLQGDEPDISTSNIAGVQVQEKANGTLIRVKTLRRFEANAISTRYSRKWLYVEVLGGKIGNRSLASRFDKGLVRKVESSQLEQMAQISLQLRKDIANESIQVSQQGNEIWVLIHTSDELNPDLVEQLKAEQAKWRIDKIVIDPGHGGKDPGAIGRGGVREKNVVLGIAKQLKAMLEKRLKVKVFMTRDRDVYVPLRKRGQYANKVGGKLFISIHANSNRNRRVRGATTYFLGTARSEEALEIAARENAVIKYDEQDNGGPETEESLIFAAMAQNEYNKESQDFAAMIQGAVRKETKLKDRGVKQAGFYVLVGASMPNVLVETAFISNRTEERSLNSSSFQKNIAEAVYKSVKQFKEKYEGF